MTAPAIAECTGLWRRSLLIEADGTRDTGGGVSWLQGISAYVDSRGFAGRLQQDDNVFEWHRDVDLEPPGPFPDAGEMRWEDGVLVETGVHADYVEHWVREEGTTSPVGALFLRAPDGANALLLRVGDLFGWASSGVVVIGPVDGPDWKRLDIVFDDAGVAANGVRWTAERTEGNVHS
jgi:hypothetical protein